VALDAGPVDMRVDLTNTDYFLLGYNVERVELWQKRGTEDTYRQVKTFPVTASNQSIFTYSWQPTTDDLGTNEFAVFVYTKFPVPGLEIAANSIQKVEVGCFSSAVQRLAVRAPNTCADVWVGTASFIQPGELSIGATVTWVRDPNTPEIDGDVEYIATGTATFHWIGLEARGCTISNHVFDLHLNATASNLLVQFGESPPTFSGTAVTGGTVTITCPGEDPADYPQFFLWFAGTGTLSANGTVIEGTNTSGNATWTWHFARP
jgi:hypothetical protein